MPPVQLGGDQRRDVDVVDPQVPDLPVDVGVDQVDAAHHDPAQVGAVQPRVGQVDVAQPGAVEPDPVEPGRAEVDALEERPIEVGVDEVSHARDASGPASEVLAPLPGAQPATGGVVVAAETTPVSAAPPPCRTPPGSPEPARNL
jgi:hypothetical protein